MSVHWMLFHCEGRPTKSAYDVVDTIEKEINAELAAWKEFTAKASK
jgi:hypothetical protein